MAVCSGSRLSPAFVFLGSPLVSFPTRLMGFYEHDAASTCVPQISCVSPDQTSVAHTSRSVWACCNLWVVYAIHGRFSVSLHLFLNKKEKTNKQIQINVPRHSVIQALCKWVFFCPASQFPKRHRDLIINTQPIAQAYYQLTLTF